MVFTTNITGYQETFTDPSYLSQIVVMTAPMIGNYGINQDDMESERKLTIYEKAPWQETGGGWQTRSGDIHIPKIPGDEPLRLECEHFLALVVGDGDRRKVAADGARVVRALDMLTTSLNGG